MQRRRLLPLLLVPLLWARQPDPVALRHIYEDALAKRERAYGSADARTAAAARDLGLYLRQWGDDSASSQQALRKALAIDEQALGKDDPQTMSDAVNLASITSPQEAELLWKRVSESSDNELSSRAFAALGDMREAAGDRTGAKQFFQLALAKQESASGKTSARVAVRLNSLALVSDPPVAIALLDRALAIDRRTWGEKHPETATTEVNLSGELLAGGHVAEAIQIGRSALINFEATLGAAHPRTGAAASTLADALRANKNFAAAEKLYRRALSIDEAAYGPQHPETLGDVRTLADFLRATGRGSQAALLEQRLNGAGR